VIYKLFGGVELNLKFTFNMLSESR